MLIYSYLFIASAQAHTHSHEVTWQDNYIATLNYSIGPIIRSISSVGTNRKITYS